MDWIKFYKNLVLAVAVRGDDIILPWAHTCLNRLQNYIYSLPPLPILSGSNRTLSHKLSKSSFQNITPLPPTPRHRKGKKNNNKDDLTQTKTHRAIFPRQPVRNSSIAKHNPQDAELFLMSSDDEIDQ